MNEHTSRITDDEVARLPIQSGRADLLEEIMATPVLEEPVRSRRQLSAWLAVPAAAAVVGAIALVPGLHPWTDDGGRTPVANGPTATPSVKPSAEQPTPGDGHVGVPPVPGGRYVALNVTGWHVTYAYEGEGEIDLAYGRAGQRLELVQYPEAAYDSYYEDRMHVSKPAPTELIGRSASTFTYAPDDHATIRPAEGGRFLEVRGSGMGLAAYQALLADLVQTDARGLAGVLPDDVVTPFNRDRAVAHLLEGVAVPGGFTAADVHIDGFNDAYQSAARVAGSVGCAWLDVYAEGGRLQRLQALAAFYGSRQWPLLRAIADEGGYAQAFWSVADKLSAGDPAEGVRPGIC